LRNDEEPKLKSEAKKDTLKAQAAALGIPYETYRSRLRRPTKRKPLDALVQVRINHFEIHGLDLPLETWCRYLEVTPRTIQRAAKKNHLNSLQELERRFRQQPHLFPKHLLDPWYAKRLEEGK
jgi:hypothetical protein